MLKYRIHNSYSVFIAIVKQPACCKLIENSINKNEQNIGF